jgi:hypothetical protein
MLIGVHWATTNGDEESGAANCLTWRANLVAAVPQYRSVQGMVE